MMGDRLLGTPSHTGENSSYLLQFRAPQFQCNTSISRENMNLPSDLGFSDNPTSVSPAFVSSWSFDQSIFSSKKYVVDYIYSTQMNGSERIGVVDIEHFQCQGISALFDLRISHSNGIQVIERNISDLTHLEYFDATISAEVSMPPLPYTNTSDYGEDVRNIIQYVAERVPAMNEKALLDAFGILVESQSNQTCSGLSNNSSYPPRDGCLEPSKLENGTSIFLCDWNCTNDLEAQGK
jgi:hypothetical protein